MQFYYLLISPIFFVLGWICFYLPEGHHMTHGATSEWQFLSSMWFMYVVMGGAHLGPWLKWLLSEKESNKSINENDF